MKSTTKEVVFWTPRVICVLFAFFMFIYAFDVFNNEGSIKEIIVDFLIRLLPIFILIVLLFFSGRMPWLGAIVFNVIGLSYLIFYWGNFSFVTFIGVAGPMFIVGFFFLLNAIFNDEINER